MSRRDENDCQRVFPPLDRDWCIGLDSQRIVHRLNKNGPSIPVWDCKPPETRSHSHLKSTSARLQHFCVNHIYQLQEYYSATPGAAKLSQKGCGQANAREKPLCITVQSEPRHIFAPCEEQYRVGVSEGVIFAEMCNLVRELATQPGKPWVRRVHQSSLFADKPSVGHSSPPHVHLHTVGTAYTLLCTE